mmetsp:Transcript_71188/g.231274  ORF Transcript_71188/g.231274 Transcript_71188/m.231274 type:complete len:473 (+) Transcript_71188:92-1510(+)
MSDPSSHRHCQARRAVGVVVVMLVAAASAMLLASRAELQERGAASVSASFLDRPRHLGASASSLESGAANVSRAAGASREAEDLAGGIADSNETLQLAVSMLGGRRASAGAMCMNRCFLNLGFSGSDCECSIHGGWYMWICKRYQGAPMPWQYCGSGMCGGCKAPQAPKAPETSKHPPASTPASPPPPALPASPGSSEGYRPAKSSLLRPSTAQAKTFYVYRVQSDADYAPENQNVANLAGAMWYLHHEIVNNRYERRFKKTRVQRFKLTTKAPQPLIDAGMDFGVRLAFDLGKCTGPFDCQKAFEEVGYSVGCNKADEFPTSQWAGKVFYNDATWYSLPGKCSSRKFSEHTAQCSLSEPGGACANPTGRGDCTYSYQAAGEISIDELEGIDSFAKFVTEGGWEYNHKTDHGVHMNFWDGMSDAAACKRRVERAARLFDAKFPGDPKTWDLANPPCNFRANHFYAIAAREGR